MPRVGYYRRRVAPTKLHLGTPEKIAELAASSYALDQAVKKAVPELETKPLLAHMRDKMSYTAFVPLWTYPSDTIILNRGDEYRMAFLLAHESLHQVLSDEVGPFASARLDDVIKARGYGTGWSGM